MGMAASQVRLLALTGRLHDIELKAQDIEAKKIALATDKDSVYEEYCDALDAKMVRVAYRNDDATVKFIDANYNTLCKYSENRIKQYAIQENRTGKIIVDKSTADMYKLYGGDKYAFAYAMLGYEGKYGSSSFNAQESGQEIGIGRALDEYSPSVNGVYGGHSRGNSGFSRYMTEVEQNVFEAALGLLSNADVSYAFGTAKADNDSVQALANLLGIGGTTFDSEVATKETPARILLEKLIEVIKLDATNPKATDAEQQEALDEFRKYLYDKFGDEIYAEMNKNLDYTPSNDDPSWSDMKNQFNFYVNLWTVIHDAGGCTVIDGNFESGQDGTDWFNSMANAAQITIKEFDNGVSNPGWNDTSIATDACENYLQEETDPIAVKKAEAKYKHDLEIIDKKDAKYDQELKKLETERTAITTEQQSLKTVRDKNIETTFGIFG